MSSFIQDLRHAARGLMRTPGFTVGAVLTLALGIGANTAIFTILDKVLLRPLPIHDADRVVAVHQRMQARPDRLYSGFVYPQFAEFQAASGELFDAMAASIASSTELVIDREPQRASVQFVSDQYFQLLGVKPVLGREFSADEQRQGVEPVIILTDAYWRARFGGDRTVIGRAIRVGEGQATIVGILPLGFRGLDLAMRTDLFMPLMTVTTVAPPANYFSDQIATIRGGQYSPTLGVRISGKLRNRASFDRAQAVLATVAKRDLRSGGRGLDIVLLTAQGSALSSLSPVSRSELRVFAALLAIVVALVLLVGCANLAGLILARNERRSREVAIRLSMGATRARLLRLFLTETLLLTMLASATGLLVAVWTLPLLTRFVLPGGINLELLQIGITTPVFAFAAGMACVTALVCGFMPSLRAARSDVVTALKTHSSQAIAGRGWTRGVLVAAQVAMSLVLVIGATLFVRSLQSALDTDVGFDAHRIAFASVTLAGADPGGVRAAALFEAVTNRLKGVRDVERVTFGRMPMVGGAMSTPTVRVDGQERRLPENIFVFTAGPDYFRTIGMPVVRGRDISATDTGTERVIVVTEALARTLWPGRDPLDQQFTFLPFKDEMRVVGVVADGKYGNIREAPKLAMYVPWQQARSIFAGGAILVRGRRDTASLLPILRQEIRTIEPEAIVTRVATIDEVIADFAMPQWMGSTLLSGFSVVALALAVCGIYGMVAYAVTRRTSEIGVRIALGADVDDVVRLMMAQSFVPVAAGTAMGLAGAYGLGRFTEPFLFGLTPHDPMTFLGVTLLLVAASLLASYIPARRAAHVDPLTALRTE